MRCAAAQALADIALRMVGSFQTALGKMSMLFSMYALCARLGRVIRHSGDAWPGWGEPLSRCKRKKKTGLSVYVSGHLPRKDVRQDGEVGALKDGQR
jgi:hypothetical protein